MHVKQPASMLILWTYIHNYTINASGCGGKNTSLIICACTCVVFPSSYWTIHTTMITLKMWTSGILHAPLDNIILYIILSVIYYARSGLKVQRSWPASVLAQRGWANTNIYHCPEQGHSLSTMTLLDEQCRSQGNVCVSRARNFFYKLCASCNGRHQGGALWDHRRWKRCTEL